MAQRQPPRLRTAPLNPPPEDDRPDEEDDGAKRIPPPDEEGADLVEGALGAGALRMVPHPPEEGALKRDPPEVPQRGAGAAGAGAGCAGALRMVPPQLGVPRMVLPQEGAV